MTFETETRIRNSFNCVIRTFIIKTPRAPLKGCEFISSSVNYTLFEILQHFPFNQNNFEGKNSVRFIRRGVFTLLKLIYRFVLNIINILEENTYFWDENI